MSVTSLDRICERSAPIANRPCSVSRREFQIIPMPIGAMKSSRTFSRVTSLRTTVTLFIERIPMEHQIATDELSRWYFRASVVAVTKTRMLVIRKL